MTWQLPAGLICANIKTFLLICTSSPSVFIPLSPLPIGDPVPEREGDCWCQCDPRKYKIFLFISVYLQHHLFPPIVVPEREREILDNPLIWKTYEEDSNCGSSPNHGAHPITQIERGRDGEEREKERADNRRKLAILINPKIIITQLTRDVIIPTNPRQAQRAEDHRERRTEETEKLPQTFYSPCVFHFLLPPHIPLHLPPQISPPTGSKETRRLEPRTKRVSARIPCSSTKFSSSCWRDSPSWPSPLLTSAQPLLPDSWRTWIFRRTSLIAPVW